MNLGIVGTDLLSISLVLNATLTNKGKVAVYDQNHRYGKIKQLKRMNHGIPIDSEFNDVVQFTNSMAKPRSVMLCESKDEVESTKLISALSKILTEGDSIIDVGDSMYMRDIQRREFTCQRNSINYFDCSVFSTIERTISNPSFCISGVDEEALRIQAESMSQSLNADVHFDATTGSSRYVKMLNMAIETALFQGLRDVYSLCEDAQYFKEVLDLVNIHYPISGGFIESAISAMKYEKMDQVVDKFNISKTVLPFMEEAMLLNVNSLVIGSSILNQSSSRSFAKKLAHNFSNNNTLVDRYTFANALTFVFCSALIEVVETLQSKDINHVTILKHWAKNSSSINCKILENEAREIYKTIDITAGSAQKLNIEALKRNKSVPAISAAVTKYMSSHSRQEYTHLIAVQRNIMYGDAFTFKR